MPLLNIANAHPNFQYCLGPPRVKSSAHDRGLSCFAFRHVKRLGSIWRSLVYPEKRSSGIVHYQKSRRNLKIKAVVTFEPKSLVQIKDAVNGHNVLLPNADSAPSIVHSDDVVPEDTVEPDDREKLRRMRISKANKGNTPWNKGRKHSPETLQRIRERTKLAMQNPKVKSKLMNLGHSQSKETRSKIGVGVRMGWHKRREKLKVQETCLFTWQNLIAESSRAGLVSEEELQWDSYKILNEQLKEEWLESIEHRKITRPKGSKRAPKSLEQRRKIAAAIAAKWADPDYRQRVTVGLAKYHGIPEGRERKVRSKPSGEPRSSRLPRKKVAEWDDSSKYDAKMKSELPKLKRSKAPVYKDPLANTKLEMIKNIRAERAASEEKKHEEALERARLLIAEAEKAAKALEAAAATSPIAQASLLETRKLIAEAIQSIESIEQSPSMPHVTNDRSIVPTEQDRQIDSEKQMDTESEYSSGDEEQTKQVNGTHVLDTSDANHSEFDPQTHLMRMQDNKRTNGSRNITQLSQNINGRLKYNEFSASTGLRLKSLIDRSDSDPLCNGVHVSITNGSPLQAGAKIGVLAPNGSMVETNISNGVSAPSGIGTIERSSSSVQTTGRVEMQSCRQGLSKKWVRGRLVEVVEER